MEVAGERTGLLGSAQIDPIAGSDDSPRARTTGGDDYMSRAPTGCGALLLCDPRRWAHRYVVLIFMCFLGFGSYFCYDNPAALTDHMKADMSLSTSEYMLFYSLYSWPNVILCFFGGFLIDKVFGIRWGAIIFSIIVTCGQVLFALGALVQSYALMNIGRFVFGMGGESLSVAGNSYAVRWFEGRALNMVFGLQLSFSRIGSTVNMNTMQPLYDSINNHFQGHVCLGLTLFVGVGFCLFSLFCAFMMGYFDKRAQRITAKEPRAYDEVVEVINFSDIKDFSAHLWILAIICVAYYVAIFPFISLGEVFFLNKFEFDPQQATAVTSVVFIVSAVASPFFGFCIDRIGMNIFWVAMGILITIACHGMLAFSYINPWIPMITLGFAYSILASALWPLVAMVVQRHHIGTAYGILQSVQNLGLAVVAIIAGVIVDKAGYLILEVFFMICLIVAFIAAVVLYLLDDSRGGKLNATAWGRRRILEERKRENDELINSQ